VVLSITMRLQKYTWPLLIVLFFPTLIVGNVFKWTDEEGKVHFGDKQPTGSSVEELKIKDKPVHDEKLKNQNEEQKKLLDIFEEERKERHKQIEEKNQIQRERKGKCEDIRKELKYQESAFNQGAAILERDEEGNAVVKDREKWVDQIEKLREAVKECCNNRYIRCN
jgi:uncharacterized protein DUF4124